MRNYLIGLFCLLFSSAPVADSIPAELQSRLDESVYLNQEFGEISYRAPLPDSTGPTIVLVHGVYAGSTHMAWREILPLLDQKARVFVFDLYGAGENAPKEKKNYSMEEFDRFLEAFLDNVVREPAYLVSESLLGASTQVVAGKRPELVEGLVLLSPTGINSLAAPSPRQDQLYERLYNNDWIGNLFYNALFTRLSLNYFLKKTVYDDDLIDDLRLKESKLAGENTNQKWLSLSFVGGQLYRSFKKAARDVQVPTLMVFGQEAESVSSDDSLLERPEEFLEIRPDYELLEIPKCGQSVQREKPGVVAQAIMDFANK